MGVPSAPCGEGYNDAMNDVLPDVPAMPAEIPDALPEVGEAQYLSDTRLEQLDARHITAERISGWITTIVISAGVLALWLSVLVVNWPPGVGTAITTFAAIVVVAGLAWLAHNMPRLEYHYCRYRVDAAGLEIYRGVLWRSVINVPASRVQHTDVKQGPLQRRFGLGTLVVHTAGTQFASVELGGVAYEDALRLRDQLVVHGSGDDAV